MCVGALGVQNEPCEMYQNSILSEVQLKKSGGEVKAPDSVQAATAAEATLTSAANFPLGFTQNL